MTVDTRNGHDARPYATEPLRATWRTPGGRSVSMWYRDGTNDWNTLCSCISEDEYALRDVTAGTVVDIGGYLGGVGISFAADHPEARVWIVEPLPANVELIARNVAENELGDRVTVVPRAAGRPGQRTATIRWDFGDDESGRHHRFVGNSTLNAGGTSEKVDAIDLAGLVRLAGGRIDLLKIDCEGAEYDILASPAVADVGLIVGEQHAGYAPLVALLQDTHHVRLTSGNERFGGFAAAPR